MICSLCPRKCGIDREISAGYCGAGEKFKIAKAMLHHWEEPPVSGKNGSGAVFFSGCNLKCVYCQNYEISYENFGKEITDIELMKIFDRLIEKGAHNLNLVTPTHYALRLAGVLEKYNSPVPVVYNTSSYESVETLKKLEGLVDIYLADLKYVDSAPSEKYSGAADYFEKASAAILEMQRQTGVLTVDENSIAKKGMIIRHMLLPGNISQFKKAALWISESLPPETHISVMRQYIPYGRAKDMPVINRPISSKEYSIAKQITRDFGFENLYFQQKTSASEKFIPDFDLEGVDLFD